MTTPPEGAQLSADGYYWWDEVNEAWVAILDEFVAEADQVVEDIPYLKFLSSELITPAVSPKTQGVWAKYEIVNIGTAPSTDEHDVSWGVSLGGGVFAQGVHKLDPPVAANGGTYEGTIHMGMEHLQFAGDWELGIQIDVGMNKGISDSVHMPFTVVLHDPDDL